MTARPPHGCTGVREKDHDRPRAPREGPDLSRRIALTVQEAADALGVSERHVRAHLGDIPHIYLGNKLLIPVDAARDWLRKRCESTNADGVDLNHVVDEMLKDLG